MVAMYIPNFSCFTYFL